MPQRVTKSEFDQQRTADQKVVSTSLTQLPPPKLKSETAAVSDKAVVASKVGKATTTDFVLYLSKVSPQLKQLFAKELCTTLHF